MADDQITAARSAYVTAWTSSMYTNATFFSFIDNLRVIDRERLFQRKRLSKPEVALIKARVGLVQHTELESLIAVGDCSSFAVMSSRIMAQASNETLNFRYMNGNGRHRLAIEQNTGILFDSAAKDALVLVNGEVQPHDGKFEYTVHNLGTPQMCFSYKVSVV
jgi:hypothetical protein